MASNSKRSLRTASSNAAKGVKKAATRNAKRIAKRALRESYLDVTYPRIYRQAAAEPVNPRKVIMLSDKLEAMPDSFSVIHERLTADYDVEITFIGLGSARTGFRVYHERCREAVAEMATASVIFVDDASGLISCLPLRPETRVIQLWHACGAFKKWGLSTAELKFGESRRNQLRHPYYLNLSLVTVSSPEVEWAYREAMNLNDTPEVVQPLGVSRTDRYFEPGFVEGAAERVRREIPGIGDRKIILYAPTFRGTVKGAKGPDFLDLATMKEALGDRYALLVRHHPFVKAVPPVPTEARDFAFHAETPAGDDLLAAADVMVTDYSSVVFEYSLFNRPMSFLAPDVSEYDDWRGFYYPYEQMTPGPIIEDTQGFIDFVNRSERDTSHHAIVDAFRKRFMRSCDGHATERILEHAFGERLEELRQPSAAETIRSEAIDGIDVSIIVPAYNAMPELSRTLQSIADQTADHARMEAIVVDDGSTDDTWSEIQRFANEHPGLFVPVKLDEPSGSPARPRNAALERARGAYVLCLDADDFIGPEAVEKMLEHAYEWGSDVLYVKMVSEGGRKVPQSMFDRNQPRVDIVGSKVLWSIGPTKLFRRTLLQENGIRFFEGGMPEDLHVTVPALCAAETISVAADYDYYHCGWRESAGEGATENTSTGIWRDFENNMRSYAPLMEHITQHWTSDERRDVLMRRLYGLDVMNMVEDLVGKPADEQARRIERIREVFGCEYVPEVYNRMPISQRVVLDVLFGTVSDNPVSDGPVSDGPVSDGPVGALPERPSTAVDGRSGSAPTGNLLTTAWQVRENALQTATGAVEGSHIHANIAPLPAPIDITNAVHAQHVLSRMRITPEGVLEMAGQTTLTSLPLNLLDQGSIEVLFRGREGRVIATASCKVLNVEHDQANDAIKINWACAQMMHGLVNSISNEDRQKAAPLPCTIKPVFRIGDLELGALARRHRLASDNVFAEWLQSPMLEYDGFTAEAKVAEEGKLVLSLGKKQAEEDAAQPEKQPAQHPEYGDAPTVTYQGGAQPAGAPKVSVLTPIYNVETYLAECIDSLKAQTLEDIEFICINDGSTDHSREILESMTAGDQRFVIVDKANSGYGKSMNYGLTIARGEYVGILESDDYADPCYFETMYELAAINNMPDIVKSNHIVFQVGSYNKVVENYQREVCGRLMRPEDEGWEKLVISSPALWAAIYKRSFLERWELKFNETPGASFQDTGFVNTTWAAAKSAFVTHDAFLHYREFRAGSSSKLKDRVYAMVDEYAFTDDFMARLAQEGELPERLPQMMAVNKLQAYWWNVRRIAPADRKQFMLDVLPELIAIDELGLWDYSLISKRDREILEGWLSNPDSLLLDLSIREARRKKSVKQYPLRLRRKATRILTGHKTD